MTTPQEYVNTTVAWLNRRLTPSDGREGTQSAAASFLQANPWFVAQWQRVDATALAGDGEGTRTLCRELMEWVKERTRTGMWESTICEESV